MNNVYLFSMLPGLRNSHLFVSKSLLDATICVIWQTFDRSMAYGKTMSASQMEGCILVRLCPPVLRRLVGNYLWSPSSLHCTQFSIMWLIYNKAKENNDFISKIIFFLHYIMKLDKLRPDLFSVNYFLWAGKCTKDFGLLEDAKDQVVLTAESRLVRLHAALRRPIGCWLEAVHAG